MPLNPLRQPPLLHNQCRLFQLGELAANVATEKLEFTTNVGTFEDFRGGACKSGKAIGGSEGGVEFSGCGAKLFRIVDGGGVDGGFITGVGA